jgi:N-acyl-D-amino-acid deacylase
VVVFNQATVIDRATFEKPHQYAEGVSAVIVNGQIALAEGKTTGARAGRVLKRSE